MNRINELRKKYRLSQAELAAQLGIAQNTLSQYEKGQREPSSRVTLQLADIFSVSPRYLLGEDEDARVTEASGFELQSATKIVQETDINRVNLYIRNGWHLIHVGEDRETHYDGSGYASIMYSLAWFQDPSLPAARELPDRFVVEDESPLL